MVPVPPLVTMNSELHFEQIYLLPVSLATCLLPNLEVKKRHQLPKYHGNCHYRQRLMGIQLGWDRPMDVMEGRWQLPGLVATGFKSH